MLAIGGGWFSSFIVGVVFLPGVASGLLVLCGSFLFGRDWGAFRLWSACSRMGRFLRRFGVGRFGAWLADVDRRVIGRFWRLDVAWLLVLGVDCFGMTVGAHISLVVSGVFCGAFWLVFGAGDFRTLARAW